ncbi:MAG TPA: hypothetical protein VH143_08025 [Kofleriaceae bacterium]|jgi:hypothetical protein|nr:hypothetical protein [Kofleriaceae bacterium]
MKKPDLDAVARNRVLLVLAVLSGETPVSTAVEASGISRGFYYQLETKALNAMLLALAPGSDGNASPDATGLHHRIKELTEKVERAEQAQRRAERLLFMQRKLTSSGPVKTHRGRPPTNPTRSTPTGRRSWRSSMTTKPTPKKNPPNGSPKAPPPTSIPTPDGANEGPDVGTKTRRRERAE